MAKDIYDLTSENILHGADVDARITEISQEITALGRETDDYTAEADDLRAELRLLAELRAAVNDETAWKRGLVADDYWVQYAKDVAGDIYGNATETPYWNDEQWSDDLADGWEEVKLDGVTFWWCP